MKGPEGSCFTYLEGLSRALPERTMGVSTNHGPSIDSNIVGLLTTKSTPAMYLWLQIAQSRYDLHTLGPKVRIIYILRAMTFSIRYIQPSKGALGLFLEEPQLIETAEPMCHYTIPTIPTIPYYTILYSRGRKPPFSPKAVVKNPQTIEAAKPRALGICSKS